MKLHIVTIVLDGMPTLPALFFNFNKLKVDWTWHIVEGASANVRDTSWCREQGPRLSQDGTHEFLEMIEHHPRVHLMWKKRLWDGKVEMVNAPLYTINEESVLLQCDADEVWQAQQVERIVQLFEQNPDCARAQFLCRYFLGVNIVSTTLNAYGNNPGEWLRAWRFRPGDKFVKHEPPTLQQAFSGNVLNPEWLAMEGLVFDHYAYAFPNSVAYKEQFYGYSDALAHWNRLQQNTAWPVRLKDFLPWVDGRATADLVR